MHAIADRAHGAVQRAKDATAGVRRPRGAQPAGPRLTCVCACGGGCPRCSFERGAADASSAAGRSAALQAKRVIGAGNDPLEHEADRIAGQVAARRTGAGSFGARPRATLRATLRAPPLPATSAADASVELALREAGRPLEATVRRDMESRFGRDFSRVRVHSGAAAERSALAVGALAYTVGPDIVFGAGQFAPHAPEGRHLIAHELAHVVQQAGAAPLRRGQGGLGPIAPAGGAAGKLQRFSDVDHHVIESAALEKVFTKEQLEAIEEGNTHRDYSQAPAVANALLLGQKSAFGGYARHEHFDNFVFDRAADRWVSQDEFDKIWDDQTGRWTKRSLGAAPRPGKPRTTPLAYIEAELRAAVQRDMPDAGAFEHLGHAFHTTEDFFAHSNFVELTQGDTSHGDELATHSLGVRGPSSDDSILGSVGDPASAAFFNGRFARARETASMLSHGRLAKDFHGNENHVLAVTLAALVVRQIGLMLKEAFALGTRAQREAFVRDPVVATLSRYFRPPSEKDKWWETMLAEDRGLMRSKIRTLQQATPVTVNQSPASPLRAVEATRFSSLKAIGMGTSLSFPIGDRKFLTIGHMLYLPGTGGTPVPTGLVLPPYVSDRDEKARIVSGLQFSGSFDETKWFK